MTDHTNGSPDDAVLAERAEHLAERVNDLALMMATKTDVKDFRKSWRAILGSYGLWVIDIIIITAGVVYGSHVADESACQAQQNDAFRHASIQSREARDAQDDQTINHLNQQIALFNVTLDPSVDPTERRSAAAAYQQSAIAERDAIVRAKQARADNPLPPGNCS